MATNLDIIKILKEELEPVGSVLDLGCGSFYNSPYDYKEWDILRNVFSGCKITGLDIYDKNIEWRREYGPEGVYVQMDILNYLFDKEYDLVICHHVLEHLTRTEHDYILKRIKDVAKKYIVIGGPVGFSDNAHHVEETGNPYEEHKIGLNPEDYPEFKRFFVEPVFLGIWKR